MNNFILVCETILQDLKMNDNLIIISKTELISILEEVIDRKLLKLSNLPEILEKSKRVQNDELLEIEQVMKILKVCRNKLFELIKNGELVGFKIGKRRLFKYEEVMAFIQVKSEC